MAGSRSVVCVLAGVMTVVAGCSGKSPTGPSGTQTTRTLTGVTISGGSSSLSVGGTATLTATATYSDGTSQNVSSQATWRSSNTAVLDVSATGLVTARATGTADISATFDTQTGRRTVQVSAARFAVTVKLSGITALDTCDDVFQGLTEGEFAVQVSFSLADGTTNTVLESANYPGDTNNMQGFALGRNETRAFSNERTYTLQGEPGQFVRVRFRATEWDAQVVLLPPSTRWVPDSDMNDRSTTATHSYANGTWSGLGASSLTLGSGGCAIRLNYTVNATRL